MAHLIDTSNNRANMAYVGEAPWHHLGSRLEPGSSIDVWLREAGLTWRARLSPVIFFPGEEQSPVTIPDRKVVYRNDTKAPLGIVSSRYKLVQPNEVLEFFRDFVEAGDLALETAGSLAGGRRIWALAKLDKSFRLRGQDEVQGYLLLATSMDGSMATQARLTSIRVVCQNTLSMTNYEGDRPHVSVPHLSTFNPDLVKAQLGLADSAWKDFKEVAEVLSARKVTRSESKEWLIKTFGSDPEEGLEEQENPRTLKLVYDAVRYSPGAELRSTQDTAWGLVQGATYYLDHVRGKDPARRMDASWFGTGETIKRRAMKQALALVA